MRNHFVLEWMSFCVSRKCAWAWVCVLPFDMHFCIWNVCHKTPSSYAHNLHRLHVLHKTTEKPHSNSFRMSSRLRLQMAISIDERPTEYEMVERERERGGGARKRSLQRHFTVHKRPTKRIWKKCLLKAIRHTCIRLHRITNGTNQQWFMR